MTSILDLFRKLSPDEHRQAKLPNLLRKTDYHVLARLVPKEKIDPEIIIKLDGIVAVAQKAQPKET